MFDRCRPWRRKLTLYGEGLLPNARHAALHAHLARCERCRASAEADQALREALQRRRFCSDHDDTPDFEERILTRLQLPASALSKWNGLRARLRSGSLFFQQALSGAVFAAALTGLCFFVTLHAPPQKTKSNLPETPLLPVATRNEPPVPLSTLLQSPTPRAALLWTAPQRKAPERVLMAPSPRSAPAKRKPRTGAKEDSSRAVS